MILRTLFEKVNLVTPLEQRRFFNYYNDSVDELLSMYDGFVLQKGSEYKQPVLLSDEVTVLPLYCIAIVDNILFLANAGGEGNQLYKTEFLRKAREAYHKYWYDNARGKRVKRLRW